MLIDCKITSTPKLAANGGSNGGLLVGAAITQRPDLFGAAIPEVGVLDMLRYQKFTVGKAWITDYGSADASADQFKYLFAYSPYHNVKVGTVYPPTLVMTSDHDDRVFPAHSFKFAAALQRAQAGDAPVLLRVQTKAGHGAGRPTEKIIDDVIVANPKQVEQYKGGKTAVIGFLVGQIMKASRGQANPAAVNELLRKKLG